MGKPDWAIRSRKFFNPNPLPFFLVPSSTGLIQLNFKQLASTVNLIKILQASFILNGVYFIAFS